MRLFRSRAARIVGIVVFGLAACWAAIVLFSLLRSGSRGLSPVLYWLAVLALVWSDFQLVTAVRWLIRLSDDAGAERE